VYNTGHYVVETINSILNNNYPDIQHIIIDDCSTDKSSLETLENYIIEHEYNCVFIKHKSNQGICKSLNEALALATGKYFFLLFDDTIVDNKIILDVNLLESIPYNFALVHSQLQYVSFDGKIKYNQFQPVLNKYVLNNAISLNKLLYLGGIIAAPTVMMRTEIIRKVGGWNESFLYEDVQMWFKLKELGYDFYYRNALTTFYRRHSNQITNTISVLRNKEALLYELNLYCNYIKYLGAKKHIFLFFYACVINKSVFKNEILDVYKTKQGSSLILYYFFKYPFWMFFYKLYIKIFKHEQ
jgi:alpha-1,3-rhamnosyltransferase